MCRKCGSGWAAGRKSYGCCGYPRRKYLDLNGAEQAIIAHRCTVWRVGMPHEK
jgi:hypothetical protein